jgi:hypothetical protein
VRKHTHCVYMTSLTGLYVCVCVCVCVCVQPYDDATCRRLEAALQAGQPTLAYVQYSTVQYSTVQYSTSRDEMALPRSVVGLLTLTYWSGCTDSVGADW